MNRDPPTDNSIRFDDSWSLTKVLGQDLDKELRILGSRVEAFEIFLSEMLRFRINLRF